jgi:integron integrase
MRKVPQALQDVFYQRLRATKARVGEWPDYLKWLQYYLDFCDKYRFPPRDTDSLQPFLQKLAAKGQSAGQQEQAASSVRLYYEVIRSWMPQEEGVALAEKARAPWDECQARLKEEIRLRQYSPKTFRAYATWIRHFQEYLQNKPPLQVTSDDARRFLTHLAVDRRVVASTQNQAFNALLFLYRHILKVDYELGDSVVRARRTRYIPVVLSRAEIDAVLKNLSGAPALAVRLLYGCGLRLAECLNLRVQCFNFDEGVLTIHDGKGRKDRTVPLPKTLFPALQHQMERVKRLHKMDLEAGYAGVFMPGAMDRKWKNAARELPWQWFFPASNLTFVPDANEHRRYRLHETQLQKALHAAVQAAGIAKRVGSHTFRHSFATHLLQANYDIRAVQHLLGHSDIKTTMIYTHTLKTRTIKECASPLDFNADAFRVAAPVT